MVSLEEALALIDEMRAAFYDVLPVEEIPVEAAVGRMLAADVISRANLPAYDTCTMDGYALRAADGYPLHIIGEAFAGRGFRKIGAGEAVYVTTGARLPTGADAVLQVEHARVDGDALYGIPLRPGTFIVRTGADLKSGEMLLQKGRIIAPAMAGVLRAGRVDRVAVYRKPHVAVIATGDEIRDGTVADANGPMVCAMLEAWGCEAERMSPVGDNLANLERAIGSALQDHDMVLTIGGVSMGQKDLTSSAVKSGEVIFKGVRVKPGKPFIASYIDRKPVFSLPGKPSGSYVAMELMVRRFLLGDSRRRTVSIPISQDVELSEGFEYVVFIELRDGMAQPVGYEGSSIEMFHSPEYITSLLSTSTRTVLADGYFISRGTVRAGQPVSVHLLLT